MDQLNHGLGGPRPGLIARGYRVRTVRRRVAAAVSMLLLVPLAVVAQAITPGLTAPAAAGPSPDGRITVTATANPTSLPVGGGSVTYTYTVKNNHTGRMYYESMTDDRCANVDYVSGMASGQQGQYIPSGDTATFRCTTTITSTATDTVTADFSNTGGTHSLATAQATVTVAQPSLTCDTMVYGSDPSGSAPGGFLGTWTPTGGSANLVDLSTLASSSQGTGTAAVAINPIDPNWIYYVPRTGNDYGAVWRYNSLTGVAQQVAPDTTTTSTNRLGFAPDGILWSWSSNGNLYSLASGATTWVNHGTFTATGSPATPSGLASGDVVFDGSGNMWLIGSDGSNNYLYSISASQLTKTSGVTGTYIGAMGAGVFNGLSFDTLGNLYASARPTGSTSGIYLVNKDAGSTTLVQSIPSSRGVLADLASCATPRPELQVQKTVTPAQVAPGGTLTYTVTIKNIGQLSVTGVTFQDLVPANSTYVSATLNGTAVGTSGTNFWATAKAVQGPDAGTLAGVVPPGKTATVTITVRTANPLSAGTKICNQGSASFTGSATAVLTDDPSLSGDADATCAEILMPQIVVAKSASPTTVNVSGPVTYTYQVTNGGNEPLRTVSLADDKCANPVLAPAAAGAGTGDLNGNAQLDLREIWIYTCTQTLSTTTTNVATAKGTGVTTGMVTTGTDQATVTVTNPSLNLTKTAGAVTGPDASGNYTATYTVRVVNSGNGAGSYGPITDTPAYAANLLRTAASWSGQATGSATGAGPSTLGVANTAIAAGATHTYTLSVTFHYTNGTQATACAGAGTGAYNSASLPAGQEQGATTDNSACAAVPAPPAPQVALAKSVSSTVPSPLTGAGQTVNYRFAVSNPGNVALSSPKVDDSRCTPTYASGDTNADGLLQAGETWIFACAYTTTQTDVDAGAVNNTATAQGTPPYSTTPVQSPPSSTSVTIAESQAIDLTKSASAIADLDGNGPDSGDRITFSFMVRNTGNATLSSIVVTDPMLGAVTCPQTTLAPGVLMSCTSIAYTLTQADVDSGAVNNTATAKGTTARGNTAQDSSSTATTVAKVSSMSLAKSVAKVNDTNTNGVTDPGDTIQYAFTVTNTGTTSLSAITVTDNKLGVTNLACSAGPLVPGATVSCTPTQTYTVTAADATAAKVVNTATTGATAAGGVPVTSNQATATQPVATPANLNVTKTAGAVGPIDPTTGRFTVAYTVSVTNSGQTPRTYGPLTDTPAFDSNLSVDGATWSGPVSGSATTAGPFVLAPAGTPIGATTTQTYAVTVTAHFTSTATATACGGTGTGLYNSVALAAGQENGSATDNAACATPPAAPLTGITLTKSVATNQDVNGNGLTDAGDRLTYGFLVRNTGTVDLTATSIADPKLTGAGATITCADTVLSPGESTTCSSSAPYTVTAADMTAGTVANTATVTGTPPNGLTRPTATSSTSTPTQTASLTLAKTAGGIVDGDDNGDDAGDTVVYTFAVTNTGNTTLTGVVVNDAKLSLSGYACGTGSLAPGVTRSCTSPAYALTQGDVDHGVVANTATAVGNPPGGATPVSGTGSASVTLTPRNALVLTKSSSAIADLDGNGADAGDRVTYTFAIQNTGTTTLTDLTLTDTKLGLTNALCTAGPVAPGATVTCPLSVDYSLTQADVNSGAVTNSATATATPPSGTPPSSTSGTSTPISNVAAIDLTKTAGTVSDLDGNGTDAGDTTSYTFKVTNTSNVPLTAVAITDPKLGLSDFTCGTTTLAPGQSVTCTSPTYLLTQADVEAGRVDNTAFVRGTDPHDVVVTDTAIATLTFTPLNSVSLVKTGSALADVDGNGPDAGDTITYSFRATNTGAQALSSIVVTDDKLGLADFACAAGPVLPGASVTCTAPAPYAVTQAEVDAHHVDNTASVTATPTGGGTVTAGDTETVTVTPRSNLSLVKTAGTVTDADGSGTQNAGDTVVYTFRVTNTGATTLSTVRISDPKLGLADHACAAGPVLPGDSVTCSGPAYSLTQIDLDGGKVDNTATATAVPPTGGTVTATDQETKPLTPTNGLALTKTAGTVTDVDGDRRPSPGDTIGYSFTVTNTGGSTLTHLTLTDAMLGLTDFVCTEGPLAPGAGTTCESPATYALTQADINMGTVDNTATATAVAAAGANPSASDAETVAVTKVAAIDLTKAVGTPTTSGGRLTGSTDAGDTVTYTFTVKNTSNVTLTGVGITDAKLGLSDLACAQSTLVPGQTATCTRTYLLTQADIDGRSVDNTASVTGHDPQNAVVTDQATANLPLTPQSSITLDKVAGTPTTTSGSTTSATDAGDTVTYDFVVTNTGATSVTAISVTDTKLGLTDFPCAAGPLAPGQTATCRATYQLTQDDIDAGKVDNTATATAASPTGSVSSTDTATVAITPVSALTLTKTGSPVVDGDSNGPDAGDAVTYTFTIHNEGTTTLAPVTITDAKLGLTDFACVASLAPGDTATCAAPAAYLLTQADVDDGDVTNTAKATGDAPTGTDPTATSTSVVPVTNVAAITLDKTAGAVEDLDGNGQDAGDTVVYSFLVTNVSNLTLSSIAVSDPKLAGVGVSISCPQTGLAAHAQLTCTSAPYILTQADIDRGRVDNTASVSGRTPLGTEVEATDPADVVLAPAASIRLDKSAGVLTDTDANGPDLGDTITYTFVVTNTGATSIDTVAVTDARLGLSALACGAGALAPLDTTTCTATYALAQSDVDAGKVDNTATGSASSPSGQVSDDDDARVSFTPRSSIVLTKTAGSIEDVDGDGRPSLGDTVAYSFTVANTGATTLTDITITDAKLGLADFACSPGPLVPGGSVTCQSTAVHALTQADIDAGSFVNTATATAVAPVGTNPSDSDEETRLVDRVTGVKLVKTVGAPTVANGLLPTRTDAGDTVVYAFGVRNSSNVTLTAVTVTDPMLASAGVEVTCPATTLAPGASMTCTSSAYALTQSDIDSARVDNTATVRGSSPTGPVEDLDVETLTLTPASAISLDKTAGAVNDLDGNGPDTGDTVLYTFAVTNTGATTLAAVSITDVRIGQPGMPCGSGPLEPGAVRTCTAPAYALTQADVDGAGFPNTATASALPPGAAAPVTATDSATITVGATPAITIDKVAGVPTKAAGRLASATDAGDTVAYTLTVTNTGNVSLDPVLVTDQKLGLSGVVCDHADRLAPRANTTCTFTYALTQADVDAGTVDNTASVEGTSPSGAVVSARDSVTVALAPTNAITLVKSASAVNDLDGNGADAGDTVDYSFTVTNTGTTTLGPATVDDAMLGLTDLACATSLAPGATATCAAPAPHALTQGEVDSGSLTNRATATGDAPVGTDPTDDATSTTTMTNLAAIVLTKTAGTPTADRGRLADTPDAGDRVSYTFLVENTSNVTLSGIEVSDAKLGDVTCPQAILAAHTSMTCTADPYVLTQGDIDAGRVDNHASVTGTDPSDGVVADAADAAVVLAPTSSVTLDKRAGTPTTSGGRLPAVTDAGDSVTYTFTVTNTGSQTLSPVTIADAKLGISALSCAPSLAPGAHATCSATYVLTQADIDAASVDNRATATGTPPGPDATPVTDDDSATVSVEQRSAITVDKTAAQPTVAAGRVASVTDAGDTVDYTLVVTNTGTTTLSSVSVTDEPLGLAGATCAGVSTLAPGASARCTFTYPLVQADLDAAGVDNTASTTGLPPTGPAVTDEDSVHLDLDPVNAILLVKSASAVNDVDGNGPDAGDTVTYSFMVTNEGTTVLAPVTVTDAKLGLTDLACVSSLAPGQSATCAAPAAYALMQDDIDAGKVDNSATATGNAPKGTDPTSTSGTSTQVDNLAALSLVKTAGTPTTSGGRLTDVTDAGDTVAYTFTVTNLSNLTLHDVVVSDPKVGTVTCPATTVAARSAMTCTAAGYVLTQGELDAGHVDNTATVTGTDPEGVTVDATDTAVVALAQPSSITLVKTAGAIVDTDVPANGAGDAGDAITYSFVVTNTGATTLSQVRIEDQTLALDGLECGTSVAPGAQTTCTAAHLLTQAEVDRGGITNIATASAQTPNPADEPVRATDEVRSAIDGTPAVTLEKSASAPTTRGGLLADSIDAGDTVTYTLTVQNTGALTLTSVHLTDHLLGLADAVCGATSSLAPGATTTCSFPYELTQADLDAGHVDNTASVTATPPTGDPVGYTDGTSTLLPSRSSIALDKQAGAVVDANRSGRKDAGDTIDYSFTVTNTGATTLDPVTITDAKLSLAGMPCGTGPLAPGASRKCASPGYVVTQGDVDAGRVVNTAMTCGTPPVGLPGTRPVAKLVALPAGECAGSTMVSATDEVTSVLATAPAMRLHKTATVRDRDGDGKADAGETIVYSFAVTNTGTTSLTDIGLTDPMLGLGDASCSPGPLAPGDTVQCQGLTTSHVVTRAEATKGTVHNVATASASDPHLSRVSARGEASTPTDVSTPGSPGSPGSPTSPAPAPVPVDPPKWLAYTGGNTFGMLAAALALIAAGLSLMLGRPRRRERAEDL